MLILFDLDDTLYDRTGQVFEDPKGIYDVSQIKAFSGVKAFLKNNNFKNVLVTKGNPEFQNKKINNLGIRDFFDEIIICPTDPDKKSCFQQAMDKFPEDKEVVVIGNRIDSEIKYGNELGLKTVLINHGKYKNLKAQDSSEVPDYVYLTFEEMMEGLFLCKP